MNALSKRLEAALEDVQGFEKLTGEMDENAIIELERQGYVKRHLDKGLLGGLFGFTRVALTDKGKEYLEENNL